MGKVNHNKELFEEAPHYVTTVLEVNWVFRPTSSCYMGCQDTKVPLDLRSKVPKVYRSITFCSMNDFKIYRFCNNLKTILIKLTEMGQNLLPIFNFRSIFLNLQIMLLNGMYLNLNINLMFLSMHYFV